VVVAAPIATPSRESTPLTHDLDLRLPMLDPELSDFCSYLYITLVIRDVHDDPGLLSDSSSNIEEESELHRFTQILQKAQIAALKEKTK
jgi:hypothetical protein